MRKRGIDMLELRSIINLTGNRNQYIASRERLAADMLRRIHGRKFFYNFPDLVDDIGFCNIESITYDRLMDTFIYYVKDCDTGHTFITERCNICLIEVECGGVYYGVIEDAMMGLENKMINEGE